MCACTYNGCVVDSVYVAQVEVAVWTTLTFFSFQEVLECFSVRGCRGCSKEGGGNLTHVPW